MVTVWPGTLRIARQRSPFTGSLWVPSPSGMKEVRNGRPSTVPRILTRPRVPKNAAEPGITTYVQPPGLGLFSRTAVKSWSSDWFSAIVPPRRGVQAGRPQPERRGRPPVLDIQASGASDDRRRVVAEHERGRLALGDEVRGEPALELHRGLQPADRIVGQDEVERPQVLGELVDPADPDERVHGGRPAARPGDRHLGRGRAQLVGDGPDGLRGRLVAGGERGRIGPPGAAREPAR